MFLCSELYGHTLWSQNILWFLEMRYSRKWGRATEKMTHYFLSQLKQNNIQRKERWKPQCVHSYITVLQSLESPVFILFLIVCLWLCVCGGGDEHIHASTHVWNWFHLSSILCSLRIDLRLSSWWLQCLYAMIYLSDLWLKVSFASSVNLV